MKFPPTAFALILGAAAWRVAIVLEPAMFNVSPITALAFCGAVYFRDWRMWLVPLAALTLSDVWLNFYHAHAFGYTWTMTEMLIRAGSLLAALGLGVLVARRRHVASLLAGSLGSSLVFFLMTNTAAWAADAAYAGTLGGWWQAMTVGHPEFPPTLWFFRNTIVGDLLFTALFALVMAASAARHRHAAVGSTATLS